MAHRRTRKRVRPNKAPAKTNKFNVKVGGKGQFRSKFEQRVAGNIPAHREFWFEELTIPFVKPATNHYYKPDLVLDNGLIVEVKGRFLAADRKKHVLIRKQYPGIEIRFVFLEDGFMVEDKKKRSKMKNPSRYSDWCKKQGIKYTISREGKIPPSWLQDGPFNEAYVYIPEKPKAGKPKIELLREPKP